MMSASTTLEPSATSASTRIIASRSGSSSSPKTAIAVGQVDGAWWPRSRDLALELRALLPVLAVRLGRIERVTYHLGDWDPAARKIVVDGSVVRMGGFRSQRACTLDVLAELHRVTLLVLPAGSSPVSAHRVLLTAGHRDNADSVAELLSASDLSF